MCMFIRGYVAVHPRNRDRVGQIIPISRFVASEHDDMAPSH